jgi:predicted exporter
MSDEIDAVSKLLARFYPSRQRTQQRAQAQLIVEALQTQLERVTAELRTDAEGHIEQMKALKAELVKAETEADRLRWAYDDVRRLNVKLRLEYGSSVEWLSDELAKAKAACSCFRRAGVGSGRPGP